MIICVEESDNTTSSVEISDAFISFMESVALESMAIASLDANLMKLIHECINRGRHLLVNDASAQYQH